jgi:hypothetical protein
MGRVMQADTRLTTSYSGKTINLSGITQAIEWSQDVHDPFVRVRIDMLVLQTETDGDPLPDVEWKRTNGRDTLEALEWLTQRVQEVRDAGADSGV